MPLEWAMTIDVIPTVLPLNPWGIQRLEGHFYLPFYTIVCIIWRDPTVKYFQGFNGKNVGMIHVPTYAYDRTSVRRNSYVQ